MASYKIHEHDVLVIGAGGAGLRAAIEASAAGATVGVVCKSLLGKAHTVMAEGGVAAALANVDDRDDWRVHFSDTMRGGQYLNNWRMAELHAKEAPARVLELEAWGAVMDRTPDGRILQRNFGGHRYPRLAHVGDRTGLELIRTLQDHGIHQGMAVYNEYTILELRLKVMDAMRELGMDASFADRYLNEGFSGGERKRNEILQLAVLDPELAILDETDSGLDIDALRTVAEGVEQVAGEENGILLITHYQRMLDYITPDAVHVFVDGRVVESGGAALAARIEEDGYDAFRAPAPAP